VSTIDDESGFLHDPEPSPDAQRLYDGDIDERGYVMNLSRLWALQPALHDEFSALLGQVARAGGLTLRQRAILVAASASSLGDSYCSLAWGVRLAAEAGEEVAGAVLRGDDGPLDPQDRALARWARATARDPNSTTAADVQLLRDAGFDDAQIFAVTVFVALRIAFSTVNDALGARPDQALGASAPAAVRAAVTFGRPVGTGDIGGTGGA